MSDPKIKDTTVQRVDTLVGAASDLAVNLVRVGTTAVTAPLAILGPKTRDDTVQAGRELVSALLRLQLSVTKTAVDVAETLTREVDKVVAEALPKTK